MAVAAAAAQAPVTEEVVFRACMCPILRAGGLSTAAAVLASPMFFAPAHLHHFWDLVQYRGEEPRRAAAILNLDGIDSSPQGIAVAVAFATGMVAFMLLAGPLTRPSLYHSNYASIFFS